MRGASSQGSSALDDTFAYIPETSVRSAFGMSTSSRSGREALTEKSVPTICPGQRTLFHGALRAEPPTDALKAAGFAGQPRFPDDPVVCGVGTPSRGTP